MSADMMKVTVIPMINAKPCYFVPRLQVFNETFSVVMPEKNRSSRKKLQHEASVCIVWNEGVAGRGTEEVSNSYWQFLLETRDKKYVTIFADNCTGQNKSWTLLTTLMKAVNSDQLALQTLTEIFEPGHTIMSADAVHRQVNRQLEKKSVFDFEDYVRAVEGANVRCV